LRNAEAQSAAWGLRKRIRLTLGERRLEVRYVLPESLEGIAIDFALSPDYLNLLRYGRAMLAPYERDGARGWSCDSTSVWVRVDEGGPLVWSEPYPKEGGHKASLRGSTSVREFTISIGVSRK
jgi:hypothetical protein